MRKVGWARPVVELGHILYAYPESALPPAFRYCTLAVSTFVPDYLVVN